MPEQSPQREELLKEIVGRFDAADQGIHQRLRERWDGFDRDWHNYRDLTDSLSSASDADVDGIRRDAAKEFGHQLFIPMTFATVESTLAQLMANPPHPVVLPAGRSTKPESAQSMGYLIADQQDRIGLELQLQSAGKSGLIYGLGVLKSRWQRTMVDVARVVPSAKAEGGYALSEVTEAAFDGPKAEAVNIRDFLWDPLAQSVETARYCIHRRWPDTAEVKRRFEAENGWRIETRGGELVALTADEIRQSGAADTYTTTRAGGLDAQGLSALDPGKLGEIHELWEYHDGTLVTYVLDRKWIVAQFKNSTPKTPFPFHAFRPTEILHSFHGKGVVEPIRDLQHELNDMRTDRRWNAQMILHSVFMYDENALDPDDAQIFPGAMIPTRGNPNELIRQLQMRDIPGSAYQETEEVKADINLTSGLMDPLAEGTSAPETATGVQLVQAATRHRINMMVRRAERELAIPLGRHWIQLNQREILSAQQVRRPVAAPDPAQPDRLFEVIELTPDDLMGELDYNVVGNSMAAENIPQQRQDAQTLMGLLSNPLFASEPLAQMILRKLGVVNPQAYLAPQVPPVPPEFVEKMKARLPEAEVNAALAAAQQEGAARGG